MEEVREDPPLRKGCSPAHTSIWDLWAPELGKSKVLLFDTSQFVIIDYSSYRKLRYFSQSAQIKTLFPLPLIPPVVVKYLSERNGNYASKMIIVIKLFLPPGNRIPPRQM